MAEYQLYCFAQSGNAYRAALMLNLIGADWQPVYRRFLQRRRNAHAEIPRRSQRNGRSAGARARRQKAQPVRRDPDLSRRALRQIQAARGEDERLEALRWIIFDNQKVNGFLGPYRFLKNFAEPAGDPAVMAFLKGRIDSQSRHRRQAAGESAVHARRSADHRRRFAVSPIFIIRPKSSVSTSPPSIKTSAPGSTA